MPEVTVAIPTFRRPRMLRRLLEALAGLATDANVTVLVADNDADKHEGFDLVHAMRTTGYRWPLHAIVVPERGIAQVRNALTAAALGDARMQFLAMLDDDEWPDAGWLAALLREQAKTGADAVQGSVLFERKGAARWSDAFDGTADIRRASGPVDMLEGTGNLLVMRGAIEKLPRPWFDPAFAFSGGEDRDFFMRLKQSGARFAWADEAIAHGAVPEVRKSLAWALARSYAIGNSDMRVFLKYAPGFVAKAREAAKTALALFAAPLLFVLLAFDVRRRTAALGRLARALGKTAALLGHPYDAYSAAHGE
jgi:succinoglycan biosynthesis protein ExoM